jgi:hypothetical protein
MSAQKPLKNQRSPLCVHNRVGTERGPLKVSSMSSYLKPSGVPALCTQPCRYRARTSESFKYELDPLVRANGCQKSLQWHVSWRLCTDVGPCQLPLNGEVDPEESQELPHVAMSAIGFHTHTNTSPRCCKCVARLYCTGTQYKLLRRTVGHPTTPCEGVTTIGAQIKSTGINTISNLTKLAIRKLIGLRRMLMCAELLGPTWLVVTTSWCSHVVTP